MYCDLTKKIVHSRNTNTIFQKEPEMLTKFVKLLQGITMLAAKTTQELQLFICSSHGIGFLHGSSKISQTRS